MPIGRLAGWPHSVDERYVSDSQKISRLTALMSDERERCERPSNLRVDLSSRYHQVLLNTIVVASSRILVVVLVVVLVVLLLVVVVDYYYSTTK